MASYTRLLLALPLLFSCLVDRTQPSETDGAESAEGDGDSPGSGGGFTGGSSASQSSSGGEAGSGTPDTGDPDTGGGPGGDPDTGGGVTTGGNPTGGDDGPNPGGEVDPEACGIEVVEPGPGEPYYEEELYCELGCLITLRSSVPMDLGDSEEAVECLCAQLNCGHSQGESGTGPIDPTGDGTTTSDYGGVCDIEVRPNPGPGYYEYTCGCEVCEISFIDVVMMDVDVFVEQCDCLCEEAGCGLSEGGGGETSGTSSGTGTSG